MTYSISHWSGRTGNNIQQVANCIMAAEQDKTVFRQKLDHDMIDKFEINFGSYDHESVSGRFYSWEPLIHCLNGCREGGNEIGVDKEYIYKNMRRICKYKIAPHLKLPKKDLIGDDTIVMHLRSGDHFEQLYDPPAFSYVPNPLIFYLNLIDSFDKCILVTEPDKDNPILQELEKIDKVQIQSTTVENDFATLMNAKNIALSGVGTFAIGAALCSTHVKDVYATDAYLTEHLNYNMLDPDEHSVHVMELPNYIKTFPCSWKNDDEQRKFILDYR
tara:strand:- start:2988 stop:3809 length:822 start_codon:yes stop_codon:yes gene_type:complete